MLSNEHEKRFNNYLKGVFAGRSIAGGPLSVKVINELDHDRLLVRAEVKSLKHRKIFRSDAAITNEAIVALPNPAMLDRLVNQIAYQQVGKLEEQLKHPYAVDEWEEDQDHIVEMFLEESPDYKWLNNRVKEICVAGKF